MPLSPQQEAEILPILDTTLGLAPGKATLYRCTVSRADYLSRIITGLRYESAIESIEIYQPDEPLYGMGLYSTIWAEPHERGLLIANFTDPPDSLVWRLIQCAAFGDIELEHTVGVARTRLLKLQKKYPIFNKIWIETGPPVRARISEVTTEELVVVDIDVDPTRAVPAPTPEQRAKARQGIA